MKKEAEENYQQYLIFTYSLTHLPVKDKVRFFYALKGRYGSPGVIKQYSIEQLGRTVLLVPKGFEKEIDEFMSYWKCQFKKKEVLVKC